MIFQRFSLSLVFLTFLFFPGVSQNIYTWTHIDPEWKKNSLDYWEDIRGFNDKVKADIRELISTEYSKVNKSTGFAFYQELRADSDFENVEITDNPTSLILNSGDLYLDLTVHVGLNYDDFPYYHGPTFNGVVPVNYNVDIYDAEGKLSGSLKEVQEVNLRDLRKSINERLSYRMDAVGHTSLVEATTENAVKNLHSAFKTWITSHSEKPEANSSEFFNTVSFLFEKRKNEFPDDYKDITIGRQPVLSSNSNMTSNAPIETEDAESAAFGNVALAEELGDAIRSVRNYALVIGVNNYLDPSVNDLDNPISDAELLIRTLTSNYTFNSGDITFLKDPKRADIINALDKMAATITSRDNLLIFYAGHGLWDERLKTGYWFPADARSNSRSNWFSNSELVGYIGGIQSKHTLLIADACFSGGIFKTREAFTGVTAATFELFKMPSRKAMTSGTMNAVPDKSVFIEFLVKRLNENRKPFLASEDLFASFKRAVINNSPNNQVPQFGEIRETGDEGGDYIFVRRK